MLSTTHKVELALRRATAADVVAVALFAAAALIGVAL